MNLLGLQEVQFVRAILPFYVNASETVQDSNYKQFLYSVTFSRLVIGLSVKLIKLLVVNMKIILYLNSSVYTY